MDILLELCNELLLYITWLWPPLAIDGATANFTVAVNQCEEVFVPILQEILKFKTLL